MNKVHTNIDAIDCDNFNNTYDMPKGHSYFLEDNKERPGKVFEHLFTTIKTGRVQVSDERNRRHVLPE